MRIIQSFWSCQETNLLGFRAGWLRAEFNIMSWVLSCLQLRKHYTDVILYADTASAKLLIDTIGLPYSEVICNLDELNGYDSRLWAFPKIMAYSQQEKPFLHVDGDVFIWKEFDKNILSGDLIAQNLEVSTEYYESIMRSLELELDYFPPEILNERRSASKIYAYNAGIIGGNDIDFFKTYANSAISFVNKNANSLMKINVSNFNIFFEQYLFYCLVQKDEREVTVLIDEVIGDNKYKGFGDFVDVPHSKHYLHLLGDYKRIESVCVQMAKRLREDYPEYYYRIIALFKSNRVPLLKDYYWFESDTSEQNLLKRHEFLKNAYINDKILITDEEIVNKPDLKDSVYCRTSFFKAAIEHAKANESLKMDLPKPEIYLADLNRFEDALWEIVVNKFSTIANSYLLARDIKSTGYAEYIFGDPQTIYDRIIVSDSLTRKIESQFDWAVINPNENPIRIVELIEMKPSEFYTLVIPECDMQGYSLASVDELDCLILRSIEKQKTIQELFDEIKFAFDSEDLENSKQEFEELIFGRIKNGLLNKSIKAVVHFNEL